MNKIFIALIISLFTINIFSQNFSIVFYNVEKLYDIVDDEKTNDDNYTPDGPKKWNEKRYLTKIEKLAKAVSSITTPLPDVIALAEVENKFVLNNLISNSLLKTANYQIIHFNGKDEEGLDVAMLYKKESMDVISTKSIPINFDFAPKSKVRDILYVNAIANDLDTLHFFINHWKSRAGDKDLSEKKRKYTADKLEELIDKIIDENKKSKIIVMGDFNDEPTDESVFDELNANNKRRNAGKSELYNLFYDMHNINNDGTFYNKDNWQLYDQIMVSQELVDAKEGYYVEFDAGKIFKPGWLLVRHPKTNDMVPEPTYDGKAYMGGTSDHLPVYIVLKVK